MAILAQSSKGIVKQKPIILIYGDGGLGKSTFGAEAPKPYFVDVEGGSSNLDVERSPKMESWDQILQVTEELTAEKHDFQTVVYDGLDVMESLLFEKICKDDGVKSIIRAAGGYGNGFKVANENWVKFMASLACLREKRNVNVIIIGHQIVSTYNDPTTTQGYDRYSIKLHESQKVSAARLWFDFCDIVLFAKKKVFEVKDSKRAIDADQHVLYTQGRAAFDAKNRYGLPFELPLRWKHFDSALNAPKNADALKKEISVESKSLDEETEKKVKEAVRQAGSDVVALAAIRERVVEINRSSK